MVSHNWPRSHEVTVTQGHGQARPLYKTLVRFDTWKGRRRLAWTRSAASAVVIDILAPSSRSATAYQEAPACPHHHASSAGHHWQQVRLPDFATSSILSSHVASPRTAPQRLHYNNRASVRPLHNTQRAPGAAEAQFSTLAARQGRHDRAGLPETGRWGRGVTMSAGERTGRGGDGDGVGDGDSDCYDDR